jgi:hypothetical protein
MNFPNNNPVVSLTDWPIQYGQPTVSAARFDGPMTGRRARIRAARFSCRIGVTPPR